MNQNDGEELEKYIGNNDNIRNIGDFFYPIYFRINKGYHGYN